MAVDALSNPSCSGARKRQRLDRTLVPDLDLWMEDGNIVIAAVDESSEDKTTYVFKCYKGLLSKHSPVFRDLLTLPQPSNADSEDSYEGLPLITLTDSYKDVKQLLQLLYYPRCVVVRFWDTGWQSSISICN